MPIYYTRTASYGVSIYNFTSDLTDEISTRPLRKTKLVRFLAVISVVWTVVAIILLLFESYPSATPPHCNTTSPGNCSCHRHVASPCLTKQEPDVDATPEISTSNERKLILRWTEYYGKAWVVPSGSHMFEQLSCPERRCMLTDDKTQLNISDAVLVHMRDIQAPHQLPRYRSFDQRWIFYLLESPYHTGINLSQFNGLFNWTSTYSSESDIPSPYGSFTYTHNQHISSKQKRAAKNHTNTTSTKKQVINRTPNKHTYLLNSTSID